MIVEAGSEALAGEVVPHKKTHLILVEPVVAIEIVLCPNVIHLLLQDQLRLEVDRLRLQLCIPWTRHLLVAGRGSPLDALHRVLVSRAGHLVASVL